MERYVYGMRLRQASPACQPEKGLKDILPGTGRYHNRLIYDRKLTLREEATYELDYLGEYDDTDQ